MDEHNQIVLPMARHVGHEGLARLRQIAAARAESALFKNLPAIGRHELVVGIENNQIEIILGCLKKNEVLAAVIIQVTGYDVIQVSVFNWSLITIQLRQSPDLPVERQARRS